jgi:hypothetical protein
MVRGCHCEERRLLLAPMHDGSKGSAIGRCSACSSAAGSRAELVALTIDHLQQCEARWVLLDLWGAFDTALKKGKSAG